MYNICQWRTGVLSNNLRVLLLTGTVIYRNEWRQTQMKGQFGLKHRKGDYL